MRKKIRGKRRIGPSESSARSERFAIFGGDRPKSPTGSAAVAAAPRAGREAKEGENLTLYRPLQGRKRVRNADEIMSEMLSNGFVVMKRPSSDGSAALPREFEG